MTKPATELEIPWKFNSKACDEQPYADAPKATTYGEADIHEVIRLEGDSLLINVSYVLDHAHTELLYNTKATDVGEGEPVIFEMIGARYHYHLVIWKNLVGVLRFTHNWDWLESQFAVEVEDIKYVLRVMVADCQII
jgi:hypothetical protein